MEKFEVGQKVKVKWNKYDTTYVITDIYTHGYFGTTGTRYTLKYFSGNKNCLDLMINLSSESLILINSPCPVCNQEVETENNKIKEHKYNSELCYGSYT